MTALLLIGIAAIIVWVLRAPPSITPDEVQQIISSRELVGLPVKDAARRLGHRVDTIAEGEVAILDFSHVRGWSGGQVMLAVEGGKVTSANWTPGLFEQDPG